MARETGTVKWFSNDKGYGFIERGDGEDVFVHHSNILGEGFKTLDEGEEVEYEVQEAEKGPKALKVVRGGDSLENYSAGAGVASDSGSSERAEESNESGDERSLGAQLREKLGRRFFGGS